MSRAAIDRRTFIATGAAAALALGRVPASSAQVSDPTTLGIAGAAPLLRSGDLSPRELVEAYLTRIERLDPRLNAYVTVTADAALARARELEGELARGRWRGPLHGIPIALKDNIDTAGIRTTAGSGVFAQRVPAHDAEVVVRLEAAGAIVLGKLNLHEFAYGATSATSHFGPVRNPWDLARITGGSSGGSGAAVAARLCAGALGTDTGGSIRIPAAHCGIVGLKPTYGLASIRGIIPLSVSLDHVGPMTRTVHDAALLLQGMAGYDPRDIASAATLVPDYASAMNRRTSGLRLGVPRTPFFDALDTEVSTAVNGALETLAAMTAGAGDVELPPLPAARPIGVEAYAYHAEHLEERRGSYAPATLERIQSGSQMTAAEYAEVLYELALTRKAIAEVFDEIDLLVTPTLVELPVTIEAARMSPLDTTLRLIRNAAPFNLYGIPTISVPCGFSRSGLPIGLQISGPPFGEPDVLSLAHAYQQATDWHRQLPPAAS